MTGKKQSSSPSLTDWAKVEAYELTAQDYADMPEWTDAQIARAQVSVGGTVIRPATGTFMRDRKKTLAFWAKAANNAQS